MTKILGLSLILLAALWAAMQRIRAYRRRADSLVSFCVMLEQMHGLLKAQALPMPELLSRLSGCCTGAASRFADRLFDSLDSLGTESFYSLWRRALHEADGDLDTDTLRALDSLGGVLGRYDLDEQLESVSACLAALRQNEDELRRALPQSRRLTLGISLCAAMLLGIILI